MEVGDLNRPQAVSLHCVSEVSSQKTGLKRALFVNMISPTPPLLVGSFIRNHNFLWSRAHETGIAHVRRKYSIRGSSYTSRTPIGSPPPQCS